MSDFKTRLQTELNELNDKSDKLTAFISSEKFKELSEAQRFLLLKQSNVMIEYSQILGARLSIL